MREDIKYWEHIKGKHIWEKYLDLFRGGKISDEEYQHIYNNSSNNFQKHSQSHYNPVRKCLNAIYAENYLIPDINKVYELDNNLLAKTVNFKNFLARVQEYPVDINLLDKIIQKGNHTKEFTNENANVIKVSKIILEIASAIRKQKNKQGMSILDIHTKAFHFYKEYYKNTNKTFYLRKNFGQDKRLISGYIFQGDDDNYVFTSPFKPADDSNNTQRIGFVINADQSCYVQIALVNDDKSDITQYIDFYKGMLDYFDIEHNNTNIIGNKFYKDIPLNDSQNWSNKLEQFLYKTVNDIISIAQSHNVPDDYLFFDDIEFKNRLKKIEQIQLVRKQMQKYDNNPNGFININVVHYFNLKDKFDYKEYPVKALLEDIKADLFENNDYYNTDIAKGELKRIFKEQNIDFIEKSKDTLKITPINSVVNTTPLNQILYGPPGTGKTHSTIKEAVKLLEGITDDKVAKQFIQAEELHSIQALQDKYKSQVEFVTFHQSFSYEDFVEGIKVVPTEDGITYKPEDGIFKTICTNAKPIITTNKIKDFDSRTNRIFKMSIGGKYEPEVEQWCLDNDYISLGWGDDIDFSTTTNEENWEKFRDEVTDYIQDKVSPERIKFTKQAIYFFKNLMHKNDLVFISKGLKHISAIGQIVGDYEYKSEINIPHNQFRKVRWLIKDQNIPIEKLYSRQLSQQSIYEFNKELINFNNLYSLFDLTQTIKPHVLIIDEINRGNISRIFGELITLIEPSKRLGSSEPLEVILPYSQKKFGVPHNLHIIATMNTADKSLMQIDTALRRRFQFIEMMPNNELVSEDCEGVNLKELLTAINARICQLLDREHQIGHSYLMGVDNILELKHRFRYQILPLLEEYFFSDWEQIKIVLNDKDTFYPKNDYGKYVLDKDNNTPYRSLSDSEWDDISQEAFINIYFTTEQNNQE